MIIDHKKEVPVTLDDDVEEVLSSDDEMTRMQKNSAQKPGHRQGFIRRGGVG